MREIKIKSMHLVNFKGIRDLEINFNDQTTVAGRNGLGKTTIFDAFYWLLFDKNSDDRKAFNIKTLDESGVAIPRIPHEVSAILSVDGRELQLSKSYKEKWVKQRGSATEEFKGHDTVCLWNDVPLKNSEFCIRIESEICTEQVFKMLTSPSYFTSLKMDAQRAMLFRMAGDVTYEQIAEGNPDFAQLLADMSGKTTEDFKKEIANKKRKIKEEVDALPARIDERRRGAVDLGDEAEKQAELAEKQAELEEIDHQLSDVFALAKANEEEALKGAKAVFDLKCKADKRKRDIETEINRAYYEAVKANDEAQAEMSATVAKLEGIRARKQQTEDFIAKLEDRAVKLRGEWNAEDAKQIEFNETDFVCPVCHRPFDVAGIETKKAEMIRNFNEEKVKVLTNINTIGKQNKAQIEAKKEEVARMSGDISECECKIETLKAKIVDVSRPDVERVIAEDKELAQIEEQIRTAQSEAKPQTTCDNSAMIERKKEITAQVDALKRQLLMFDQRRENEARIAELEKMLTQQNQALADLEATEYDLQLFSKARVERLEERVNSLFTKVKFKMFNRQINGGETETCEPMVDGVPFADLNNAGKINCGLDIINAIIKAEGISAPIFVDNAEAVNRLFPVPAQTVRLVVSEDEKLTIK